MYYPGSVRYPDVGMTEIAKPSEGGVLDLCTRRKDKDRDVDRYSGDVSEGGYAGNGFYPGYPSERSAFKCSSEELMMQRQQQGYTRPVMLKTEPDSSPGMREKAYPDVSDGLHPAANSPPPNGVRPFTADPPPPIVPCFLPLPTKVPAITTRNGKPTRPFKAYPKDFRALATSEGLLDDSNKRYMEFRRQFLTQLHPSTGLSGNKNMKRPVQSDSPNQVPSSSGDAKDQAYWERRKKNNEAAKKSRDARRAKEDEIAIRAAFLEREYIRLKLELAAQRDEVERLRCMLFSS